MSKPSYWELLRDPRWQRKRLEIMEREGFACEQCGETTKTLNVHHTYYARGRKPWEYEPESLRCLCEDCHALVTERLAEAAQIIGSLDHDLTMKVIGFARALLWISRDFGMGESGSLPVRSAFESLGILAAIGVDHIYEHDDLYHPRFATSVSYEALEQLAAVSIDDTDRRRQADARTMAAMSGEEAV